MYEIYLNDSTLIYSSQYDLDELSVTAAELNLSAGKAGSFSFSITPKNLAYTAITKLTSYIDVYRDTVLIFSGRVISIEEDFNLTRKIVCEGLLAIFNDSIFRPITVNESLIGIVEMLINSHNNQVSEDKQVTIGTIDIEDEYLYREFDNYETTMSRLSDLVEIYGGYLILNKQNDGLYLNWVNEIAGINQQTIDFGINLLDLTQEENINDIVTVLIPLGAQIESEDGSGKQKRLTIERVNGGMDYIVNQEGVTEFGYVVGVQTWDDVTVDTILKSKAENWLSEQVSNKVTINVTAVDLAIIDSMVDYFMIGQTIHVLSAAHNINRNFILKEQKINFLDPTQNNMVLGETVKGYISSASNAIKTNSQTIEHISQDYVVNEKVNSINDRLVSQETAINQTAESIESVAESINETIAGLQEQLTEVRQTSDAVSVFVSENGEVISYFRLDSEGLWIGRAEDPIRLLETNQAIKFVDSSGNTTLLEINTEGIISPTVTVEEQISFLSGSTQEWAIRKGSVVDNRHNLNDIWIGG